MVRYSEYSVQGAELSVSHGHGRGGAIDTLQLAVLLVSFRDTKPVVQYNA